MSEPTPLVVRPCFLQDLQLVQLIYAHHVLASAATFEFTPPDLEEMTRRWTHIVEHGWPFLVAAPLNDVSRVLGYAYAQPFRDRPGYARTFEHSIYVAHTSQRQGVGARLLGELLATLRNDGVRQVLAVIGDSANAASISLHQKAGFAQVGLLRDVGEKFGRAYDVVIMQRRLPLPKGE